MGEPAYEIAPPASVHCPKCGGTDDTEVVRVLKELTMWECFRCGHGFSTLSEIPQ